MTQQEQRSTFVTVVAWIFIVIGGFSTLMTLLQNIMLFFFFPLDEMKQEISSPEVTEQMPAFFQFVFSYFNWFFFLAFVVSVVAFVSAIGLLKRKNWARIVFVTLMSIGIVWNLGSIVLQFTFFQSLPGMEGQVPPPEFQTMQNVIMAASTVMALAFAALFGWIIKRLTSNQIVEEFTHKQG